MNCHELNQLLDDLLITGPEALDRPELAEHLAECPSCASQHALAVEALAAVTPHEPVRASAGLKRRIVGAYSEPQALPPRQFAPDARASRRRRTTMALAAAALVLIALGVSWMDQSSRPGLAAFSLLSQAAAAENRFFARDGLVHLVNEIIVKPVSDAQLAAIRWLPLVTLAPNGKPRYDQLKLAAEPDKGYTVRDVAWYDPATGRFARVLTVEGRPLFAHSFDGQALYTLTPDDEGKPHVERAAVTETFQPPKSPADFLGLAAGLTSTLDAKDRADLVSDAGRTKLDDGAPARVVKLGFGAMGPPERQLEAYFRVTIRDDDRTIASFEFVAQNESLFVVRRVRPDDAIEPEASWDLAGFKPGVEKGPAPSGIGVLADLVKLNVSVEQMLQSADFPVYIFSHSPNWAGQRQIVDILDVASPPHRMFAATYRSPSGRHVVLVQAHTFNANLGPLVEASKLVYTSPGGVKVYAGPHDEQLAKILLDSARAVLGDAPSPNRVGYLLTTPEGTHPALAVNGKVTDDELHALIDSLEIVKK